ncbi:hypothetical protein CSHISOI_09555 [Colletotrichum shisoi]|uniref:Aminoglycoside phosphotransferase domain-containing protein n=1 Tax=Colletotrichum shisoi TaxID=2078593 RepID=A0A5Q4BGF7_9PEZI|nr:hypothetical protein CSHISOI_09555 [Colletotrichum shisoi]
MVSTQDLNRHREAGCTGFTTDKKYYEVGTTFIKRTLRSHEWPTTTTDWTPSTRLPQRWTTDAAILTYLQRETDIPLPRLQYTLEDDGAFYFSTELVPGVSMSQLAKEQKQAVTKELLNHIATLKSLRSDTPGVPGQPLLCAPNRVHSRLWKHHSCWRPRPDIEKGNYVFCHNDLGQHNVIVDPQTLKINAIIDWEYGGFWPEWFEQPYWEREGPGAPLKEPPPAKRVGHLACLAQRDAGVVTFTLVSRSTYDFTIRLLRKRCMHVDSTRRLSLLLLSILSPPLRSLPPTLSLKCITSLYLSPFGRSLDDKPTAMWVREIFCEVCDSLRRLVVDMPFGSLSGYDDHLDVRPTLTDGFQRLSKLEELVCLRDYPALAFMPQTFTVNCWSLWPKLRRVVLFRAPMSSHWLWYDVANTASLELVVLARPLDLGSANIKDDYHHMLKTHDYLAPRKLRVVLADVESDLAEVQTSDWAERDPEGLIAVERYHIPTSFYGDEETDELCCGWVKTAALNGSIWDWEGQPVAVQPEDAGE